MPLTSLPAAAGSAAVRIGTRTGVLAGAVLVVLLLASVLASTRSTFFGDTSIYVEDITTVLHGQGRGTDLLEFGHLIWRPLGAMLADAPAQADKNTIRLRATTGLIRVSLVAAVICAIAMWILLRLIGGVGFAPAMLACAAFVATNGFIVLARTGSSYLPGLACLLVACCLAIEASRRNSIPLSVAAAVMSSCAALFWVPYVLAVPLAASASLLVRDEEHPARRLAQSCVRILPLTVLLTIAAFAVAVYLREMRSTAEFWAWVRYASHGPTRGGAWLRMLFGLPRSFMVAGDDGVIWKQFLFRDPFAGVGWWDVVTASAWRIVLFYGVAAVALVEVVRRSRARGILLWAVAGIVPTLALAVAFEAGSVERYLALYPAAFVAFAWVMSQRSAALVSRVLIALFCVVLVVNNVVASSKSRIESQRAGTLTRIGSVLSASQVRPDQLALFTINIRDSLLGTYDLEDYYLHPSPRMAPLIPSVPEESAKWESLFGKAALSTWNAGGEVWVTKHAWADRPRREWLWVESDDPLVRWKNIRATLAAFEIDSEAGGPDGFYRVSSSPGNLKNAARLMANLRRRSIQEGPI